MIDALISLVVAFTSLITGPVAHAQGISQLDQWKATSTPYSALTTLTDGRNLYLPRSNATTSTQTANRFCLTADTCITSWPTGGGSSFAYPFPANATTTAITFTNGASVAKLTNLTGNGFVKTSGSDGTLSIDTSTYLTSAITSLGGLSGASQTFSTTSATGGFGFSSSGTTHTLNIPTASGTTALGLLSAADWTTFNNKGSGTVTSVTGTWPIISSGGATPALSFGGLSTSSAAVIGNIPYFSGVNTFANVATSTLSATSPLTGSFTVVGTTGSLGCQTASGSQAGCLSSTDWTTFNNKSGFAYPFALAGNATSTLTQFNGGLTAFGTSTIGGGTNTTGLTVFGTATTTGNLIVQGTASSTFARDVTIGSGATSGVLILGGSAATIRDLSNNGLTITSANTSITSAVQVGISSPVIYFANSSNAGYDFYNTAGTNFGRLSFSGIASTDKTFTFPNTTGTVCLTTTCASFSYLFPSNATSTLLTFSGGASTTALSANTLAVGQTATTTITSAGFVGIGTSSPHAALSFGLASSTIAIPEYNYGSATSTSELIDCRSGSQTHIRIGTSATTLQLNTSSLIAGQKCIVVVENPNAAGGAITWTVSSGAILLWAGGTVPTQTTTANKMDVWSFLRTAGSSTPAILGAQSSNF